MSTNIFPEQVMDTSRDTVDWNHGLGKQEFRATVKHVERWSAAKTIEPRNQADLFNKSMNFIQDFLAQLGLDVFMNDSLPLVV